MRQDPKRILAIYRRNLKAYEERGDEVRAQIERNLIKRLEEKYA